MFPYNNSIIGSFIRDPFGIYRCTRTYSGSKGKLLAIVTISRCVPSAERVTKALHFVVWSWLGCNFIILQETRSIKCTSLSILIKNQPVTFRCVNRKRHITFNLYVVSVLINSICFISLDIFTTRINKPSNEAMQIIFWCIRHIHCVWLVYSIRDTRKNIM